MRMSHVFSRTLREVPAGAESMGYGYLVRAGFIQQLGAGIFSLLPLGLRSVRKDRDDYPRGNGWDRWAGNC